MKITIEELGEGGQEEIILRCRVLTPELTQILSQLRAGRPGLIGYQNEEAHRLSLEDVYYFEVVDNKSFLYCREAVFESRQRLYEFEEQTAGTAFFRASKSLVLNSDKIRSVKPAFSGRFEATLLNGEKVVVSRQYVSVLKQKMGL